jgi:hypothetical protein
MRRRLGDTISEGDELEIQSSMTVVIPAWRITELLNLEAFEMARQKRDDEREAQSKRRPRSEAANLGMSTDENPNHLEDFKRLVDVAARKQEKD